MNHIDILKILYFSLFFSNIYIYDLVNETLTNKNIIQTIGKKKF